MLLRKGPSTSGSLQAARRSHDSDCPSSSLCPQQLLQEAAEVALALLLQSQLLSAGGAERNEGSMAGCAEQSQPLPKGGGMWSKRSPYKKKVYIFINAKINI